jgi:hypothetical protein
MAAPQRTSLKLTGHSSAEKVKDLLGSYLVDVAHVVETHPEYLLVEPDDTDIDLNDSCDCEWFERVVVESLRAAGERSITAHLHKAPASPP